MRAWKRHFLQAEVPFLESLLAMTLPRWMTRAVAAAPVPAAHPSKAKLHSLLLSHPAILLTSSQLSQVSPQALPLLHRWNHRSLRSTLHQQRVTNP